MKLRSFEQKTIGSHFNAALIWHILCHFFAFDRHLCRQIFYAQTNCCELFCFEVNSPSESFDVKEFSEYSNSTKSWLCHAASEPYSINESRLEKKEQTQICINCVLFACACLCTMYIIIGTVIQSFRQTFRSLFGSLSLSFMHIHTETHTRALDFFFVLLVLYRTLKGTPFNTSPMNVLLYAIHSLLPCRSRTHKIYIHTRTHTGCGVLVDMCVMW